MDRSLYVRPSKPKFIPVTKRARDFAPNGGQPAPVEILAVDRATECHVTPATTGATMADYLDLFDGCELLEPQCGTGNLIAAVLDSGYKINVSGVERHYDLFTACERRFRGVDVKLIHSCFLDFAKECDQKFDRILTNPPFRKTKEHIAASLSLLAAGGVMVALVPITFTHPDAEDLEILERGLFASTDVHTKLIGFYK